MSIDSDELTIADAERLRVRLARARSSRAREAIARDIDTARSLVERRRASVPQISYPPDLPVTAARERIAEAIRDNRVVIVAGETGSGKTTQLPKICLDLGLGVRGMIGHTQPRRLAARSVSERIADELGEQIGTHVGYQVRFTDTSSPSTLIKVMTDGILLNEINRDRRLSAYDTIIIDEAHERSLNIDFILGYLARLLQSRDDLKVIVTSATIDPERFVEHFRSVGIEAPIIEVSGRTYPVEVRYRPLTIEQGDELIDRDEVDGVCDAVSELLAEGDGDILVFLSGEREIRDTADALRDRKFRNLEILPLYGRLSAAEQHRVFQAHTGRRVVLSTNVAETSLTVPGIRYVVDPGMARISRYSLRSKVQRLPIEPISQASARQRAGRCGRVADGVCIRLYSEDDFDARPAFTEPEIQRTNLASVVLRMAALRLGRIEDFPFVDPPDPRAVRDGIAVLTELGALAAPGSEDENTTGPSAAGAADSGPRLTAVGRELAGIPLDPRMARMLHEAHRTGVLAEVLVIVSALSIQDVRERPTEHRGAADAAHARFAVPGSDFLAYLRLWDYLRMRRDELSSSAFRRLCRTEYLHYLRVREWQDLHGQLRGIVRDLGWQVDRRELPDITADDGPPPLVGDADRIHRAILAGLLTHIGLREGETRDFAGVRGTKFAIFPGSSLANKPPRWVMAGEVVETSRLWARTVARIEPEWVEQLADHLVKRQYAEPHWSTKREAAMIRERVTLFGVPLVTGRPVQLSRIDPPAARELFIRHALVEGQWRGHHRFLEHNRRILEDTEDLENRARRRDILVDDDALFDFYDRRIDEGVITARQFDSWWKKKRREVPDLLDFTTEVVTNPQAAALDEAQFPRVWQQGEVRLDLSYLFEPGHSDDGVTATIPVALLDHVRPVGFDWLVPGMRHDLATALIRTLPKELRRRVVPAPDIATAALARMPVRTRPFVDALAAAIVDLTGVAVSVNSFRPSALDPHLQMAFRVVDETGRELGRSRDFEALRVQVRGHRPTGQTAPAGRSVQNSPPREGAGPVGVEWTAQTFGTLSDEVTRTVRGMAITAYPGLTVDGSGAASVRMYPSRASRDLGHRRAVARLAARRIHLAASSLVGALGTRDRLALSQSPYPSTQALIDDIVLALVAESAAAQPDPHSPPEFDALVDRIRSAVTTAAPRTLRVVAAILGAVSDVSALLDSSAVQRFPDATADVREQLAGLIFDGFVFDTGSDHLGDLPRYLTGARLRLEALPASGDRDRAGMVVLDRVYAQYAQALEALPEGARTSEGARQPAWMIEELRIGLFAQSLGTAYPISEKRINRAITALSRR